MGTLEKRAEERMRRSAVNNAIIAVIASAGIIALAAVAPNAIAVLGKTTLLPQQRYRARTALARMIGKGYVRLNGKGAGAQVQLTEKGKRFAALMHDGRLAPGKPRRWDGKWRVVSYDFHGQASALRARVRELLTAWGFVLLHQSVWVYPYDCEDLIFLLKHEFKIGRGLLYLIAEEVENDATLRKRFQLPPRKS